MRQEKSIVIDGLNVVVREVSIGLVRDFVSKLANSNGMPIAEIFEYVRANFFTNLSEKDFNELGGRDLFLIWKTFEEVNGGFLQMFDHMGVKDMLKKRLKEIRDAGMASIQTTTTRPGQ